MELALQNEIKTKNHFSFQSDCILKNTYSFISWSNSTRKVMTSAKTDDVTKKTDMCKRSYFMVGILWPSSRIITWVVQEKTISATWPPRIPGNSFFIEYSRPHHLKQKNQRKQREQGLRFVAVLSESCVAPFFINNIIYSFL